MINDIKIEMMKYNSGDTRRINHALKVHSYAKTIGEAEALNTEELFTLEAASVLHDIGIKECERKYNKCGGYYQQIEGPPVARELLSEIDIESSALERVIYLISRHHTFKDVDGKDYQILLEADLIVNAQEKYISQYAFKNAVEKLFVTEMGKYLSSIVL